MNPRHCILPLALFPIVALADVTTVYTSNFSSGAANPAQGSYATGDWAVLSSRSGSQNTISYASNAFGFGLTGGSSAVVEAQSRFSNTPVALSADGDYIQLRLTFTATNNILSTNTNNATLNVGLYDATGGGNPVTSLANGGLVATGGATGFETGFAAGWKGYAGRFGHVGTSTSNNQLMTRPAQTGEVAGATEAQDLVFNDGVTGGYDTPAGVIIGTTVAPAASFSLTNGSQYTISYRITQTAASTYTTALAIYSGAAIGDTALESISGSVTGVNAVANQFNALAIGYRFSGTSAASSITLNSFDIQTNTVSAVPEPSTYAALVGLAGLAFAASRRRRA